jgi:hypothetical protein
VDEPDLAIELRVPGEALFDAGHADQDRAQLAAVVVVAELCANDRLTWPANLRQAPGVISSTGPARFLVSRTTTRSPRPPTSTQSEPPLPL